MSKVPRIFKCLHCDQDFEAERKSRKYCSRNCFGLSMKIEFSEELKNKIISLYESGLTQKQVEIQLGLSKDSVQAFFEKHKESTGYQVRKRGKLNQTGANNDFWKGGKTKFHGYIAIRMPNHPRTNSTRKYVLEHILVMEEYIGRYLVWKDNNHPDNEIVHHINGIKTDNRVENLVIMLSRDHSYLHSNQKWAKEIHDTTNNIIYPSLKEAGETCGLNEHEMATYIHFGWQRNGVLWRYNKPQPQTGLKI